MGLQLILIWLLGIVGAALAVTNAFLLRYYYSTNKKIDKLLENGNIKDFKDIFLSQKDKNDDLETQIKDIFSKIKNLENISEITIRKIGLVRFNPFNGMGGNQSFTVAILDNKNNGFIISSLFTNDGNRVYGKTVKGGESDYTLSGEEQEAIDKAIKGSSD